MPRRVVVSLLTLALLGAVLFAVGMRRSGLERPRSVVQAPEPEPETRPELPRRPPLLPASGESFPVERLQELDDRRLTAAERTDLGIRLLRLEMRTQTQIERDDPEPTGHDWVMSRIVEKLASGPLDPAVLHEELKYTNPGHFETTLHILLAFNDDREQLPALAEFLEEDKWFGWLREQALIALGRFQDRGTIDTVFRAASRDVLVRRVDNVPDPTGEEPPGPGVVYPVRKRALEILREWHAEGMPLPSYAERAVREGTYQVRFASRPQPPTPPTGDAGDGG